MYCYREFSGVPDTCSSPWYNHNGWLGITNQLLAYLLADTCSLPWSTHNGWLGIKHQVTQLLADTCSSPWSTHNGWLGIKHQVTQLLADTCSRQVLLQIAFLAAATPKGSGLSVTLDYNKNISQSEKWQTFATEHMGHTFLTTCSGANDWFILTWTLKWHDHN